MNTALKGSLIAIYALACISLAWPLPFEAGPWLQKISGILLAIHLLETVVMFKHVRKYQGPLATSILLSLLFGLLHWLPLSKGNVKG
jgi:uncharacterized protein YhhL (DUF1145 family)